ncbi:MAG: alpha/beta fold hydrolase [Burkholderiaceae bacterium]|nr:alpha/beta fold hydrolase [Burkholderiaceae bacterium]
MIQPGLTRRAARLSLPLAALLALTACTALDERTRLAIYRPTQAVPASFAGLQPGDQRWFVNWDAAGAPAQRVQLWWLPHADPAAPTLLYLHGTFRNLYHNHPKMQALRRAGFSVLAVEYRGWGDSSRVVPTEGSIHADADIGWAELVRRQPDPRKRVIFGHSMGGAVAVHLASRQSARASFAGLILESTFTQLPDVAAQTTSRLIRPLAVLSGEHMNSLARIGNIRVPLLMLHGDADRTVPIELGRELFAAAATEPKQFVVVPGGTHSQLHVEAAERYQRVMAEFARHLR